ncbi:hypothetical protein [Zhihengliuella halotolerans]|uniref:hypothetical protein n=1 Tax=Zhihengliuella halotolerans TaxID=370736 RepID=UPI0011AEE0B1|nr:hypothetical protein [Zhihengliuella halotolerans]
MSDSERGSARLERERQVMADALQHAARGHTVAVVLHRYSMAVKPLHRMAAGMVEEGAEWRVSHLHGAERIDHASFGRVLFFGGPTYIRGLMADVLVVSDQLGVHDMEDLMPALESSEVGELVFLRDAHG